MTEPHEPGRPDWRQTLVRAQALVASAAGRVQRAAKEERVRKAAAVAGHLLALGVTTYVFLILNKHFFYAKTQYDEEFFTWGGWCILKGLAPYRDFIEFKPPMVFITHALAQALFGLENFRFRIFFTVVPLASLLALQVALVARGVGRVLSMATVILIISLFVNSRWHDTALSDSESIGMTYYLFGLACLLWEGRFIRVTTTLGGFFMTLCLLSKEPFLGAVVPTMLGMFWLRGRPSLADAKLYLRCAALGIVIAVVLLCVYMVPTGAMKAYVTMARNYGRIYSDPKRSYCVALGLAHPSTPMNNFLESWGRFRRAFFNEGAIGFLAPFLVPGAIFAFRRSGPLFACMVLATFGVYWSPTVSNCMWPHYYNMSIACIAFILVAGMDSMKQSLRTADRTLRLGVGVAAVGLLVIHLGQDIHQERKATYRQPPFPEPQMGLFAFIKANTAPSDRIFTTGTPALYAYADRVSAVRETNIIDEILGSYDGDTDEEKLRPIYQQLVKNKPKVVFLDPEHGNRKHRHYRTLVHPFLAEFKYKKVNELLYVRPD